MDQSQRAIVNNTTQKRKSSWMQRSGCKYWLRGGQKVTGPTRVQNDETELRADALQIPATWGNRRVTKAASSAVFKYSQCVTILICSWKLTASVWLFASKPYKACGTLRQTVWMRYNKHVPPNYRISQQSRLAAMMQQTCKKTQLDESYSDYPH